MPVKLKHTGIRLMVIAWERQEINILKFYAKYRSTVRLLYAACTFLDYKINLHHSLHSSDKTLFERDTDLSFK